MPRKKTPKPAEAARKFELRQCSDCPTMFVPGRPRRETGHPTGYGDRCTRCHKRAERQQPVSAIPERLTDGRQRVPHKVSLHPDLDALVAKPETLRKYGVTKPGRLLSVLVAQALGHPELA